MWERSRVGLRRAASFVSLIATLTIPAQIAHAGEHFDSDFGSVELEGLGEIVDLSVYERGDHKGEIVALGGSDGGSSIARLRPSGRPDPSFGDNGRVTLPSGTPAAVETYRDGSLRVVTYDYPSQTGSVYRVDATGNLGTRFGGRSGRLKLGGGQPPLDELIVGQDRITAEPTANGGLMIGGTSYQDMLTSQGEPRVFLLKISRTGAIDNSFSRDGLWRSPRLGLDPRTTPTLADVLVSRETTTALWTKPYDDESPDTATLVRFRGDRVTSKPIGQPPEPGTDLPDFRVLAMAPGGKVFVGGTDYTGGTSWGFTLVAGLGSSTPPPLYAPDPIYSLERVPQRGYVTAPVALDATNSQRLSQFDASGYLHAFGPEPSFPPVAIARQNKAVIVGGPGYSAIENSVTLMRWRPPVLP